MDGPSLPLVVVEDSTSNSDSDTPISPHIPLPFPEALNDSNKKKPKPDTSNIEELFKQIVIHLPLFKAIEHIPAYAKFLKQKCTPFRRPRKEKKKTKPISAFTSLPRKQKDPGAPIITCSIGDLEFSNTLLDDGASINLLPSKIYEKFDFGPLGKTDMNLCMADQSTKTPRGILEDVIVTVQGHDFPVDFVVLDIESTHRIDNMPIILGRPFLATARVVKNYEDGTIQFAVDNEKFIVDLEDRKKKKEEIGTINECLQENSYLDSDEEHAFLMDDPLEATLTLDLESLEVEQ